MTELLWSKEFGKLNDQYPEMFGTLDGWNLENEEVLRDFLRALRRKKGFGLFFVQCNNPAQGERVIASIRKQSPQKRLQQFDLNRESETLYGEMQERYKLEPFAVACITGVEQVLLGYEDTKRLAGWTSQEIYNYSWKGVPPLLSHLNRQREAFESNLPVALVFLVRGFVIDYFIQRAPDFFDWRSGFFKFTESAEDLQKLSQDLVDRDYREYCSLTLDQQMEKILEIKEKILQFNLVDGDQRSSLLREQGRLFEIGGESIQALDCYYRSLTANSQNYKTWNSKGLLLNNLERYEEAIESYDKSLEIKPDYYNAWILRGIALRNLEECEEAVESFDKALEIKSDEYKVWSLRGTALYELERYEEAIESYDKSLEIKPDDPYALNFRGDALHELERYEEAVESYNKSLKIKPDNPYIWYKRGRVIHKLERYEEAVESYDKSLKVKPNNSYAWILRGIALRNLERCKEAIESYDKALEIKSDEHNAWNLRGDALHELERYEEAVESYDKALEIKADDPHAWDRRGKSLRNLKRYEEAVESYDKALEIKPDYTAVWTEKGVVFYQLGKLQEASDCFAKVAEIQPNNKYSCNNQGYLNLAQVSYGLQPVFEKPLLIRQQQYWNGSSVKTEIDLERCQKSIVLFETALQLDPEFTIAWANCSFPAYYLQQYQTALQNCDRALELDPDNQEDMNEVIYTNRGCILLQLQNPTAALQDFTSALSLAPHLDEAWIGKGTALYQLERYSEAHKCFSQALALKHPLAQNNLDLVQKILEVAV